MQTENNTIIIYDGDCAFCSWCVLFVLKHKNRDQFRFAALSSNTAQAFFAKEGITDIEMIRCITAEATYTKSSAVLAILGQLHWSYKITCLGYLIPKFLRDAVYDLVSRNRKRLIRGNVCPVIPVEYNALFLD